MHYLHNTTVHMMYFEKIENILRWKDRRHVILVWWRLRENALTIDGYYLRLEKKLMVSKLLGFFRWWFSEL